LHRQATADVGSEAKVIVFAQACDAPHVQRMQALFNVHAVLKHPVSEQEMESTLAS